MSFGYFNNNLMACKIYLFINEFGTFIDSSRGLSVNPIAAVHFEFFSYKYMELWPKPELSWALRQHWIHVANPLNSTANTLNNWSANEVHIDPNQKPT